MSPILKLAFRVQADSGADDAAREAIANEAYGLICKAVRQIVADLSAASGVKLELSNDSDRAMEI